MNPFDACLYLGIAWALMMFAFWKIRYKPKAIYKRSKLPSGPSRCEMVYSFPMNAESVVSKLIHKPIPLN